MATFDLPAAEVERLDALPHAAHGVRSTVRCEYEEHGSAVWHCGFVQAQDGCAGGAGPLTSWWVQWVDGGSGTVGVAPSCGLPVAGSALGDGCLLRVGHPGGCGPLDPPTVPGEGPGGGEELVSPDAVRAAFRAGAAAARR